MSDYHVEKRRVRARLLLTSGAWVAGDLFLADSAPEHAGPEWVADMLNRGPGFVPCDVADAAGAATGVVLYNRTHVVVARLEEPEFDRSLDPSYSIALRRPVSLTLANGDRLCGELYLVMPEGHTRVSDYACTDQRFRYLETGEGTSVVNFEHVLEIVPEREERTAREPSC